MELLTKHQYRQHF